MKMHWERSTILVRAALSLTLGIAAYLFWRVGYPFALAFQEQFQLFLFGSDFLVSRLVQPGGVARYIGEFVVQFYNNVNFGALLLAVIFVLMQLLTWRLMWRNRRKDIERKTPVQIAFYILSFVPVLTLWFMLGDENVMMSFIIAVLLTMALMLTYPRGRVARIAWTIVGIPLTYWVCGPSVLMLACYVAIRECVSFRRIALQLPLAVIVILYALACIYISSFWLPYPLARLMRGIDYYRFPLVTNLLMWVLFAFIVILTFVMRIKWGKAAYALCALPVFIAVTIHYKFDPRTYELMEYEYLVRLNDWDGIIKKAEKKAPDLPMSVCATNLALGMTDQLGDRAFEFGQHGTEGLLPVYENNFLASLLTGEMYYQLGLINTAQRFAFESMEALPNCNKSGRIIKRLAQTAIINGDWEVARKYLNILERTMFYGTWAKRTKALLYDDDAVNSHPVYGRLRSYRLTEDFLFSEPSIDRIMGRLFLRNNNNSLAMQYMLLCPLLNRDLNTFMSYMATVEKRRPYRPTLCQQGIIAAYVQIHQNMPQGSVTPKVAQDFQRFMQAYRQYGTGEALEPFRNTLWYYLVN